ncbi:MAG: polysaccharide biosynthesis protein [Rhodospirillales bacterium]|nr:polysaccharide biosynthesis protein [Rhodospirillales bacterium]
MSRMSRSHLTALHDVVMAALSFVLALYLRLGSSVWTQASGYLFEGAVIFALIAGMVFLRSGVYRGVWRYASLPDVFALARASALTVLVFLAVIFLWSRVQDYPRSSLVINWFTLMALVGGPRMLYRIVKDGGLMHVLERANPKAIPVAILGADDEAEQFARAMIRDRDAPYAVVGMIDPTGRRTGQHIRSVPVHDGSDGLDRPLDAIRRSGPRPHRLVLTSDNTLPDRVREALKAVEHHGMTLSRIGRLTDFSDGVAGAGDVRPVAVEDLLGRAQASVDRDSISALVAGQRILVTGAGGTIGGELVRQIAALEPAHLTLVELSEVALYEIDMEMQRRFPGVSRRAMLRDIRDRNRLDRAFEQERPDIVFHAAALKHVPLAEANPNECVLTNVGGTMNLAGACRAASVEAMVLISTDKAVHPSGVMGATKRLAELYIQALGTVGNGTRFAAVRFGNVLGSTGSVVPLFQKQLAEGGPLTVTHPDMTRFMMTVREAVELVLQASALGGESGDLFVLDMGEPVRIQDLARQMIRLAGKVPDEEIEVVFTGIRPGEKMHEELVYGGEALTPTARDGIRVARGREAPSPDLVEQLAALVAHARAGDAAATPDMIRTIVPTCRAPDAAAADS